MIWARLVLLLLAAQMSRTKDEDGKSGGNEWTAYDAADMMAGQSGRKKSVYEA